MNEPMSRALLYGGAVLAMGGIAVMWANTETEADVLTLLSSADVQLRMAHAIPENDLDGEPLDKRQDMIASAIEQLEIVERIQPGMAVTAEFRGFAHMLHGEFVEAAQCYGAARACEDCGDEQRDVLAFNQARMLAKAGQGDAALEIFRRNKGSLDERYGHQRRLEEAQILQRAGRAEEALERLRIVDADVDASPLARLQAGQVYLDLGYVQEAGDALESIRNDVPIADYFLARLKLRQGDVDTAMELLERVNEARPAEVRQRLRDEAEAWSVVSQDARFQRLTMPLPASPGR
ncbi:MAG: tetratricopeptide repeat protein [Planctomycetes bacterium]|nr:tetratricopeptide repeat protein [Planctomycetota bacterium]